MAIYTTVNGNVGGDAELRYGKSGKPILGFSVATKTGYGESEKTEWVRVSLFGDKGEKLAPHITKGKSLMVVGTLRTREYEGKNGKAISLDLDASSIEFTGSKPSAASNYSDTPEVKTDTSTAPF